MLKFTVLWLCLTQTNTEIMKQTPSLPSDKKCPGYTGDRMPNEQNYKEEATLEEKKFQKETDANISKLLTLF